MLPHPPGLELPGPEEEHCGSDWNEAPRVKQRQAEAVLLKRRWRPVSSLATEKFPSLDHLLKHDVFMDFHPLLPVKLLQLPRVRPRVGHRQRHRDQYNRQLTVVANQILDSLNSLNDGLRAGKERTTKCKRPDRPLSSSEEVALSKLLSRVRQQAADVVQARQDHPISGAQGRC